MRLIDADLLEPDADYYDGDYWAVSMAQIQSAPTIEERKTGKWINAYPDIEPNQMLMYGICSVCGFEQSISDKLKYCPNCGARLLQEGEDNGTVD